MSNSPNFILSQPLPTGGARITMFIDGTPQTWIDYDRPQLEMLIAGLQKTLQESIATAPLTPAR